MQAVDNSSDFFCTYVKPLFHLCMKNIVDIVENRCHQKKFVF